MDAEVADVNLAGELRRAEIVKFFGTFTRHHVLFFRDQEFNTDVYESYVKYFGLLDAVRTAPEDKMYFHTDQCYYQISAKIISL